MGEATRIILSVLGLTYLFTCLSLYGETSEQRSLRRVLNQQFISTSCRFDDPVLALKVLKKLDVFEPVDIGYTTVKAQTQFNSAWLALKPDFEYCDKHRALFVENPSFMFTEKNFITGYQLGSNLRKHVIPNISGSDPLRQIHAFMPDELYYSKTFDTPADTQAFFIFEPAFYVRELGTQFSCQTQMSNHIPGHENLYRKDRVSRALFEYNKQYETRPQCFNIEDKFFLKVWVLQDAEQCKSFFTEFNSPKYQRLKREKTVVYFRKIGFGVHQGKGVFPIDEKEEVMLRELYSNGALCGQINNNYLIQYSIHNPLLFNGRQADFRIPMLIASTNPLIVYYNDGFLRFSAKDLQPASTENCAFLDNLDLSKHTSAISMRNETYNNMTGKQSQDSLVWSFDRLQEYLLQTGKITDSNWLNNYFRPELKKMLVHLVRMSHTTFAQRSSVFEIFGVDVMIDDNLNLWFIEANAKPGLEGSSQHDRNLFISFQKDCYEVLFGLLRSRAKRIVEYVNKVTQNGEAWASNDGDLHIEELVKRQEEFKLITRNYWETDFEPQLEAKYGFDKIIDENLSGVEMYHNIIAVECL